MSLLGTGSGTFIGPIFVMMKIPPEIGTATSGFMMIFSSSSTCIQYLISGKLQWDYALWFGGVGLASAIIGQIAIRFIIRRMKIAWILLIVMILLLVISFVLLIPMLVIRIKTDFFSKGGQTGFTTYNQFCSSI